MPIEIKHHLTGDTLHHSERATIVDALAEAFSICADLRGADLRGAYLSDADLSGADLSGAYLSGADLSDADLSGADLRDAYLRGAYLSGADLSDADLSGADLRDAYLRGAYLRGADLRDADLSDADGFNAESVTGPATPVPAIPNIHQAVLTAVTAPGQLLDMSNWHSCETTHCRAGWVVHLAGEAGRALEEKIGPAAAAMRIYLESDPALDRLPKWHVCNDEAMADIVACAEREKAAKV